MKIEYNSEINAFLSATLDVQERLLNTETRHETKQLHWIKCKKKYIVFFPSEPIKCVWVLFQHSLKKKQYFHWSDCYKHISELNC